MTDLRHAPRVGLGWDRHRLEPGRRCVLGGVEIASELGPAGHSDGDAVLHALTDALLGAAGLDDLGSLFPDHDPAWKDADSTTFLREALRRLAGLGLRPLSADLVVVCDRPRLAPARQAVRGSLAGLLGLPLDRVNLKGKTTEGGDAGRIDVQAVVLVGPSEA
ncbi:MAG: 2-C-methyl-D-erythritol 2,4-cyclodiphosphate synthase [Planctomycetes bacterium]|nr:2-C-methyl-D-erythritol 2,4-cyclodiphosphate synthase [Planctomycetota bacterium]MBL7008190.1 2-C-methyl-D-erythritol 2,4-cyclodiphosphate synthase [Planctomycetota bacterium]